MYIYRLQIKWGFKKKVPVIKHFDSRDIFIDTAADCRPDARGTQGSISGRGKGLPRSIQMALGYVVADT
jgi:hypothetical protein